MLCPIEKFSQSVLGREAVVFLSSEVIYITLVFIAGGENIHRPLRIHSQIPIKLRN